MGDGVSHTDSHLWEVDPSEAYEAEMQSLYDVYFSDGGSTWEIILLTDRAREWAAEHVWVAPNMKTDGGFRAFARDAKEVMVAMMRDGLVGGDIDEVPRGRA